MAGRPSLMPFRPLRDVTSHPFGTGFDAFDDAFSARSLSQPMRSSMHRQPVSTSLQLSPIAKNSNFHFVTP